ncbi:hypothetical protein GH808_08370 [Acetobacterium fimetarium]|uniref:PilX N-terminal n=1 Tax=Acetobacterium fimetarium TaxID=52691 RepID=A0ABR6WVP6_9FIRM|nr:hypothetical protein [Acetobacterium fimetarium]MBC3804445.1 hypothetical protein [Acetobacterium fimetarium]
MQHKIIRKLKSEEGSSLAFVIIIGVVILMLVASIMAIANSDFTFTQQSLESRQAYIDAKSVIEYGKIEIRNRKSELEIKNNELKALYDEYSRIVKTPDQSTEDINKKIADKIKEIDDYMKSPFYIGCVDKNNVSDTLKTIDSESDAIGILSVESKNNGTGTSYTYKIDTKNLRRNLDYEVNFDYLQSSKTETSSSGGSIDIPDPPSKPTYDNNPIIGISGNIYKNPDDSTLNNTVSGYFTGLNNNQPQNEENKILTLNYPSNDLNICNGFTWVNGRTLKLTGQNICVTNQFATSEVDSDDPISYFNMTAVGKVQTTTNQTKPGEIYFVKKYTQLNHGKNTLTANGGDVIFKDGLVIGDKGTTVINCENLFIEGDITLRNTSALYINAKNVIISGNVTIEGSQSKIYTNCENIWVGNDSKTNGKINISNSNSLIDVNNGFLAAYSSNGWSDDTTHYNLNYFSCGNVSLDSGSTLCIKGSNDRNQMKLGNITTKSSGAELKFLNVNYLSSGDMHLEYQTKLTVTGISDKTSQMVSGVIRGPGDQNDENYFKSEEYHALTVRITNFAAVTCKSMSLDGNSTLVLNSAVVKITNYLSLSRMTNPIEITTQYLDVTGKTYIGNIQDTWPNGSKIEGIVKINAIQNKLNIRFNGGYEQCNSTVDINNAQLVMFEGDELKLDDADADLYVQSDNINLDSTSNYVAKVSLFRYENNTSQTNVFIKSDIQTGTHEGGVLKAGNYTSGENKTQGTLMHKYFTAYKGSSLPVWPAAPGSGTSVVVNPGSIGNIKLEKYY